MTMAVRFVLGASLLVVSLPLAAAAQSQTPSAGDLELQRKQRRAVVLPKPSAEEMRSDADRAVSDYAATLPRRNTVRETSPVRPSARPDLDYDVKSGIQGQRLNDALRGR